MPDPTYYAALTDDELRSAWADESESRLDLRRKAQGSRAAATEYAECLAELKAIRTEWLRRGMRG